MPIKLLSKDEVSKARNSDVSKEIAEGLKISRRVDRLRELQSEEDAALAKFREETLAAIQQEIGKLSSEKEVLFSEVSDLREEKARGLKILDEKEEILFNRAKELDKQDESLKERLKIAESVEKEALEKHNEVQSELLRAKTHTEEAERLHALRDSEEKQTERLLIAAQRSKDAAVAVREETEAEASRRIGEIEARERSCKEREERISEQEKEIAEEKVRLEDQRQTLERAMKRLQNG